MIKIIDSIMDSGKTTWAISYMNANPQRRFIYITPYLQEAERIVEGCPALRIKQPSDAITKQAGFLQLLREGENMAISHELFMRLEWTDTVRERIQEYGYVLILDEALEVVKTVPISKPDYQMLTETQKIGFNDDGHVLWLDPGYQGEFAHLKRMAKSRTLLQTEDQALLWVMPVQALWAVSEMYVFTFMFNGSHMKHYLNMHGLHYQMAYVEGGELREGIQNLAAEKSRISRLLDVYEGPLNNWVTGITLLARVGGETDAQVRSRRSGMTPVIICAMSVGRIVVTACGLYLKRSGKSVRPKGMPAAIALATPGRPMYSETGDSWRTCSTSTRTRK